METKEYEHNQSKYMSDPSRERINCQQVYSRDMEMQIVREYLNGASTKELCEKYGYKTQKSIHDKVRKYGEEVRSMQEECDRVKPYSQFSVATLDNEFKAYFVGLMLSDGWVIDDRHTVAISMTDEDVISFLSSTIGKSYTTIQKSGNRQLQYRIVLTDQRIHGELQRYGIVQKKSKILEGFELPLEECRFFPYIIRGMLDGDGWVRKDGKEFFICTASEKFANWIRDSLETRLYMTGVNLVAGQSSLDDSTVWYVRSGSKRNIEILKLLVYDKPFGMRRKFNLLHDKPSETIMETPA